MPKANKNETVDSTNQAVHDQLYDDVFHTLMQDHGSLILPVINEVFGEHYSMDENIKLLQNEIYLTDAGDGSGKVITDSNIQIANTGKRYHIECQSTADGKMILRMYQYDSQMAVSSAKLIENRLIVDFPTSCVIYLRADRNTPDELVTTINTPGGSVTYNVKTIKMLDYDIDAIFGKQLYFLVPFYFFNLEQQIHAGREADIERIDQDLERLRDNLNRLVATGELTVYDVKSLVTMTNKIAKRLAAKNKRVQEEVDRIMGGQILDYEAKTIYMQGQAEGQSELIRIMYTNGMSIEQIASATNISVQSIKIVLDGTK